jgi:acyl-CoA synthetase (AMP-forming)/AMP-acid ligase II
MNIGLLLGMARDGFGDRVLLGSRSGGITAAALDRLSAGGARAVRESGADAVVYLDVNGPAFPVALFAAARAGVPMVPLNYRLGGDQLTRLLANHKDALVVAGDLEAARLRALGATALSTDAWLAIAGNPAGESDPDGGEPDGGDNDGAAVLIYTSGTTSAPKGVVIRHSHLLSYVLGTVEFASADEKEAALISVPPYHIAAVANVLTNLYAGRRAVVLGRFTAAQWLDVARAEQVTNALVVPTMLARIMEAEPAALRVPSLRALSYGGAAMPAPVIERALRAWPDVAFVNAYGLTETSSTIAVLGPDEHRAALASEDPAVRARLSSAGRVLPTVEVQIRGDDGTPLPAGETGRIWVRGGQVSGEYAGTGSVLDADGFFDTRDHGWVDADGFLFIAGRADDTIIRGGENIAPAEIETVLLEHPDVNDAVVVGVPDEEWGQRIEAAVVLRPGAAVEPEALREFARTQLRGSKTPDRVVIWEDLPRTETGKLIRRQAVARLTGGPVADPPA